MWRLESGRRPTASVRERRTGDSWYVRPVQEGKVVEELMEVFIHIARQQENSLVEERTVPEPDVPSSTTTPQSVTDVGSGESSTAASSVSGPLATNPRTNQVAVAYPMTGSLLRPQPTPNIIT